jgi:pantoate kinase
MNKITEYGEHCLHKLRELLNTHRFSLDEFFELSYEFALRTGLINSALEGAVEDARKYGFASMAMLGKTVFAMGDTKKLVSVLRKFGKVYTCTISTLGARAIPASFNPK